MEKKEKRVLKPYHGIIFFVIAIVALLVPGAYMQYYLGTPGLVYSELLFLVLAVLYVIILRGDLKKVFPVRKLKLVPIFGTVLLWIGTFLIVMVLTLLLSAFFPKQMLDTSQGLNDAFSSMSVGVQLLVVALLPAICEEAMHRGVIMNSFRSIRNKWIVIVGVGILFGINHMDIWRFVPTAVLGISLTYVAYETDNLLYSILYHFINNGFASVVSSFAGVSSDGRAMDSMEMAVELYQQPMYMMTSIGMYMIMSSVAPFLIYTAAYMVRLGKEDAGEVTYFPKKNKGWMLGALIGLTIFLFVGGAILLLGGMLSAVSSIGVY